ncbi:MAG: MFS transporter [Thermoplasmataceae archaeon]
MKLKSSGLVNLSIIQIITIVAVMTFSVRSSNNVLQTTLPLLSKYNYLYSQFEVGTLIALMSLSGMIAMIINGLMHGDFRRYSFILANVVYAVSFLLFSFSGSISIVIYAIISGFSYGLIFPNIMTAAGISEDKKVRERMLAIYSLTLALSLIGGPALESLILRYFPLKEVFLLFLPIIILSTAVSPFLKFPEENPSRKRPTMWDKPGFKIAIYTFIVYSFPTALIISFGGIFAVGQFHASYSFVTLLSALFFASSFLTRIVFSSLSVGKLWPYVVALMIISLSGLLLIFISSNLVVYSIGLIVLGIPHGLGMPVAIFAIGRSFPASERNTANSYFTSTMMLTNIIIPLFGGAALEFIGLRSLMLYIVPVVVVLLYLTFRLTKSVPKSTVKG